ncbi:MAG TPA: toprim domain-containing protein, partial [Magnetococcales bacterium]|nr:toprim domain-containing protein [Magnetococcales bacterium]
MGVASDGVAMREGLRALGIRPGPGGGEHKLICPQCHGDRKKNTHDRPLAVNVDHGVWFCHHCGWKGKISKRVMFKVEKQYEPGLPTWGENFLRRRGIDPGMAMGLGVGRWRIRMSGEMREVLAFACHDQGRLVNVKYRGEDKTFRQIKGGVRIPFNLDRARTCDTWIWTEGEMDVLALAMAGLDNALSVPDGAPPALATHVSGKMAWLGHLQSDLVRVKRHVLAVDNDGPGQRLEKELIHRLGAEVCFRVQWPEGVKDANDCLRVCGAERLKEIIGKAVAVALPGLVHCHHVVEALLKSEEWEGEVGVEVGFEVLDRLYRPRPGELTVV